MQTIRGQNQKNQRHMLTLAEKLKVLQDIGRGLARPVIAARYNISTGQVSKIKKNAEQIKRMAQNGSNLKCKRACTLKYPVVDAEMRKFLLWMRSERLPVSGNLLKEQAKNVAEDEGLVAFTASNGWLDSFLKRNNISRSINYVVRQRVYAKLNMTDP